MNQQLAQQQQVSYQQQLQQLKQYQQQLHRHQQQYLQLQQCGQQQLQQRQQQHSQQRQQQHSQQRQQQHSQQRQQQHSHTISVQPQQQYGQESNYSPYYHQDIIPSTPRNYYQQQQQQQYPHSIQRTVSTSSFTPPSNNQQYQQQQYPHSIQRSVSTPTFNVNNNNNKAWLPPKSNDKIQPQIMAKDEQKPQTIDPKQTIPTFKQLSTYKVITLQYCQRMNLPKPIEVCIENKYWNICWDYLSPKGCKRRKCKWTHIDLNDSEKKQFSKKYRENIEKNRSRFIAKVRMNGKTTSGGGSSKINAIYNVYKKLITSNIVPWQSVNKCESESETKQKSQELELELENDDKDPKSRNNISKSVEITIVGSENSNKQSVWRLLKVDDVKKKLAEKNDKNDSEIERLMKNNNKKIVELTVRHNDKDDIENDMIRYSTINLNKNDELKMIENIRSKLYFQFSKVQNGKIKGYKALDYKDAIKLMNLFVNNGIVVNFNRDHSLNIFSKYRMNEIQKRKKRIENMESRLIQIVNNCEIMVLNDKKFINWCQKLLNYVYNEMNYKEKINYYIKNMNKLYVINTKSYQSIKIICKDSNICNEFNEKLNSIKINLKNCQNIIIRVHLNKENIQKLNKLQKQELMINKKLNNLLTDNINYMKNKYKKILNDLYEQNYKLNDEIYKIIETELKKLNEEQKNLNNELRKHVVHPYKQSQSNISNDEQHVDGHYYDRQYVDNEEYERRTKMKNMKKQYEKKKNDNEKYETRTKQARYGAQTLRSGNNMKYNRMKNRLGLYGPRFKQLQQYQQQLQRNYEENQRKKETRKRENKTMINQKRKYNANMRVNDDNNNNFYNNSSNNNSSVMSQQQKSNLIEDRRFKETHQQKQNRINYDNNYKKRRRRYGNNKSNNNNSDDKGQGL